MQETSYTRYRNTVDTHRADRLADTQARAERAAKLEARTQRRLTRLEAQYPGPLGQVPDETTYEFALCRDLDEAEAEADLLAWAERQALEVLS